MIQYIPMMFETKVDVSKLGYQQNGSDSDSTNNCYKLAVRQGLKSLNFDYCTQQLTLAKFRPFPILDIFAHVMVGLKVGLPMDPHKLTCSVFNHPKKVIMFNDLPPYSPTKHNSFAMKSHKITISTTNNRSSLVINPFLVENPAITGKASPTKVPPPFDHCPWTWHLATSWVSLLPLPPGSDWGWVVANPRHMGEKYQSHTSILILIPILMILMILMWAFFFQQMLMLQWLGWWFFPCFPPFLSWKSPGKNSPAPELLAWPAPAPGRAGFRRPRLSGGEIHGVIRNIWWIMIITIDSDSWITIKL